MTAVPYADTSPRIGTPGLFGQVMGLVALTVAFASGGVFLAKDWGGATWFIAWIVSLGCLIGLNVASAKGNRGLALVLLFGFGLTIGMSIATTLDYYMQTDPTAVRQAISATALSVGVLGSAGYAIRKDLSFLYRFLFWALLALLVFGIVLIFVNMPAASMAYSVIGLVIFGLYTVVDFNRIHRAGQNEAIPLAAAIFLDVLNIFLFFLRIFGRR